MKKILYQVAYFLRKLYRFIVRPKTRGVKVVVECDGEVLMIKNAYGSDTWTFPGGGVGRGESPEVAALREVREEVGIPLSHLKSIGEVLSTREYNRDTIYCYIGKSENKEVKIDFGEIQEARWFNKNQLPSEMSLIAREIVSLWK